MNKVSYRPARVAVFFFFVFLISEAPAQQTIAEIKKLPLGSVITTTGIITTGTEWGQIRYMQDHEAGIAIFSPALMDRLPGDSILITGVLSVYKGQLQIAPVIAHQLLDKVSVPQSVITGTSDPSLDDYYSMKVSFHCIGFNTCKDFLDDALMQAFDENGMEIGILLPDQHSLIGESVHLSPVRVNGILSNQNDRITLLVNSIEEAASNGCSLIYPGIIDPEWGNIEWLSNNTGKYWVEYGQVDFDTRVEIFLTEGKLVFHYDTIQIGNIYKARLILESQDTIVSPPVYFSPQVPSAPVIHFFFNKNLDDSYSDGSMADGTGSSVIAADIISRIDNVDSTLDIAMYNTTHDEIIQAVSRAAQRGVKVRYIADDETSNSGLEGVTEFPVFYRTGSGLMHHKFVIGDAHTNAAWVWTGSTNFSSLQLFSDPNHAIVIYNRALAGNYLIEFNELWGDNVNHDGARAGETKFKNSVHKFRSGETLIESYFSPSDETACSIIDALQTADHHVELSLLLLTKEDMINEIIAMRQRGVEVRMIIEDEISSSDAIDLLEDWGVQIAVHHFSQIFHHKYAVIDEGYLSSDPIVITGSHNWTFSADRINDENTLIIHSQKAANIFRQEFEARWTELLNTAAQFPQSAPPIQVSPNPANVFIEFSNKSNSDYAISLMDLNGIIIKSFNLDGHSSSQFNLDDFHSGTYIVRAQAGDEIVVVRFVVSSR